MRVPGRFEPLLVGFNTQASSAIVLINGPVLQIVLVVSMEK